MTSAAHILLSHSLLDHLADALSFPESPGKKETQKRSFSETTTKMTQMLQLLKDWVDCLKRSESLIVDPDTIKPIDEDHAFKNPIPKNLTTSQKIFASSLQSLAKSTWRVKAMTSQHATLNFELMAVAIAWFGQVNEIN